MGRVSRQEGQGEMKVHTIGELDKVIDLNEGVLVVAVGATWSGSFSMMLSALYGLKRNGATLILIDIDRSRNLVEEMQCSMIPTLYFYLGNKLYRTRRGYTPLTDIRKMAVEMRESQKGVL